MRDTNDLRILQELQKDASLSQRQLAERVGLSPNACWRRVQKLRAAGVLGGSSARIDAKAAGLGLTVFVMIRTRQHNRAFAAQLRAHVEAIPEVTEMHRIGGDWDYLLKVVTTGMEGYDRVYRQLIDRLDLETVTGLFSMETMFDGRPLALPLGG